MPLTTEQTAALTRLNAYNGNGYSITTNPYGFARGGNQAGVFVGALKDVALIGQTIFGMFDPAVIAQVAQNAADATAARIAAQTAATDAANAYDAFDDRYLGAKSSAPTLDNDGNALLVGAIYFDTMLGTMRVWTGSAWGGFVPAAVDYYTKTQVDAANATQDGRLTALENVGTRYAFERHFGI